MGFCHHDVGITPQRAVPHRRAVPIERPRLYQGCTVRSCHRRHRGGAVAVVPSDDDGLVSSPTGPYVTVCRSATCPPGWAPAGATRRGPTRGAAGGDPAGPHLASPATSSPSPRCPPKHRSCRHVWELRLDGAIHPQNYPVACQALRPGHHHLSWDGSSNEAAPPRPPGAPSHPPSLGRALTTLATPAGTRGRRAAGAVNVAVTAVGGAKDKAARVGGGTTGTESRGATRRAAAAGGGAWSRRGRGQRRQTGTARPVVACVAAAVCLYHGHADGRRRKKRRRRPVGCGRRHLHRRRVMGAGWGRGGCGKGATFHLPAI